MEREREQMVAHARRIVREALRENPDYDKILESIRFIRVYHDMLKPCAHKESQ